jgi:hypothetical protein
MIDAFVWPESSSAWGHAAMYVDNPAPGGRRYISFWPRVIACAGENPISGCAPGANTYPGDVRLEGRAPAHDFNLNYAGRPDFSEAGILAGWARIKRDQPYYAALRNNCCTVVARLLLESGGGAALTGYGAPLVWTPATLVQLLRSFPLRVAAAERLVVVAPPAGVGP